MVSVLKSVTLLILLVFVAACASSKKAPAPVEYGSSSQTTISSSIDNTARLKGDKANQDGVIKKTTKAAKNAATGTRKAVTETKKGVGTAVSETKSGMGSALASPLRDFNARRVEIPEILKALETPYNKSQNCKTMRQEVLDLTEHLGPDFDEKQVDDRTSGDKAGKAVGKATLDVVSGTTTGIIPFRSIIRKISGATAYERRMLRAYSLGLQRRAYLKGMMNSRKCKTHR